MNITLEKEWAGYNIGRELTVSDIRGEYLKKIGVAVSEEKEIISEPFETAVKKTITEKEIATKTKKRNKRKGV